MPVGKPSTIRFLTKYTSVLESGRRAELQKIDETSVLCTPDYESRIASLDPDSREYREIMQRLEVEERLEDRINSDYEKKIQTILDTIDILKEGP